VGKKVRGSHAGIYHFDHIEINDSEGKYPQAIYISKEGEGWGTYELPMEIFIELKRPDRIKVEDTVESLD